MDDPNTRPASEGLPAAYVRLLLDACWKAKSVTELMPELPKGMKPRYVHVIDAVWHINAPHGQDTATARVGDVSAFLGVTTPSVAKLIGEMTGRGLLVKHADDADRRAVTLTLTERGLAIRKAYVADYHEHLSELLAGITQEECETVARVMNRTLRLMRDDGWQATENDQKTDSRQMTDGKDDNES
ncbi:MarR family transcriptional regulator [Bifidobacterium sp. UTCIF-37]|uniref:MarR family winged helix-turn-helix transcriptional regulator n=1 Tax=unclassified Bifidobacterium TaxID=2608897 RepID=UPI002158F242|nr:MULTISPECIES: MarR family winged helix-turn-helix transcriptional regulator [unclassified Bifidobacterium]TPF86283.1 MarR family transcriptional regulator [Bifidobacterium sp. UTCIF-37]TPF88743.1 MarR family transcriptional regulator [Bifidobacterium sp. UTCIF-38]